MNCSSNKTNESTAKTTKARGRLLGMVLGAVTAAASVLGISCAPDAAPFQPSDKKVFAGGIEVDGNTLNDGYFAYMRYCYACHGEKGDGKGPSSFGLAPPPRDFTKGIFKFARLRTSDDMPHDDDLVWIVKGGLHGTAMLPWDVPEEELRRILQYIKTFAPQKWEKKKRSGEPVKTLEPFEVPADPWTGKVDQAIQKGKELYHLRAECLNCHPAYDTKEAIYNLSVEASKRNPDQFKAITGFREDPYLPVAKDSPEYGVKILPPDFLFNRIRSVREGTEVQNLFRLISFGVYPIMPAWKGAGLTDDDIWALAHYVNSIAQMRDTPAGEALKEKIAKQPAFEVPKPPEPKPAEEAAPAEGAEGDKAADEKKDEKKEGEAADKKDDKKDAKKDDKKDAKKDAKKAEEKK